jgi:hypothetical protein
VLSLQRLLQTADARGRLSDEDIDEFEASLEELRGRFGSGMPSDRWIPDATTTTCQCCQVRVKQTAPIFGVDYRSDSLNVAMYRSRSLVRYVVGIIVEIVAIWLLRVACLAPCKPLGYNLKR